MQKYMRWSGILVVLMLVLAACSSGGGASTGASEEPGESAAASDGGNGGTGSAADCDADEFGCIELAEGDPIVIGTAMVITGANESLGLDSQYGAQVAQQMRPQIAGHDVEFNHQDDGCSTEGGTAAARALLSVENIAAVIGTSCSSAGIPAAEILSAEGIMLVSPSNTAPPCARDRSASRSARPSHVAIAGARIRRRSPSSDCRRTSCRAGRASCWATSSSAHRRRTRRARRGRRTRAWGGTGSRTTRGSSSPVASRRTTRWATSSPTTTSSSRLAWWRRGGSCTPRRWRPR